jgi:hypothetical protein
LSSKCPQSVENGGKYCGFGALLFVPTGCTNCKHSCSSCHDSVGVCADYNKWEPEEKEVVNDTINPLDTQEGGDHYKKYKIQPVEFVQANSIKHCEASIIKYAVRHQDKNGIEDINKIIHYAKLIAKLTYNVEI